MAWLLLLGGAILVIASMLGRRAPRVAMPLPPAVFSPVTQQHLHLIHGGRLSETAVASAKTALAGLLARGDDERVEASLRPGLQYAVQVSALAELGGRSAANVLHRQLGRRLSTDPIEQSWYWIDVAHGLRRVNRPESLSHVLRCPARDDRTPLGELFAAEAVCCPGFLEALRRPRSAEGQSALRLLHRTLFGLRNGLAPEILAEGRLGAAVAAVWDCRYDGVEPLVVRVLVEGARLARRSGHLAFALCSRPDAAAAVVAQTLLVRRRLPAICEYLGDARGDLLEQLAAADDQRRSDCLSALDDLRADAGTVILAHLGDWPEEHRRHGVRLLRWSPRPETARQLCVWGREVIQYSSRMSRWRRHSRRPDAASKGIPGGAALFALRGHASAEAEDVLIAAAGQRDGDLRVAALSSLGWWQPFAPERVLRSLHQARHHSDPRVCHSALAALARLGERRALQAFRLALIGQSAAGVSAGIRLIASQGLYWLWPEVDALADAEEIEAALAARECLEQLHEELIGGPFNI